MPHFPPNELPIATQVLLSVLGFCGTRVPAARAIFAFWQAKKEAEREAAKKRIEEARPRPRPCLLSSPPPHEPIASESNVLGTGDALRMGATGPCGDIEHHVATQHNLLQQHASTYYNTYDRIVRSGTSDSKASCSPDRHRPLRQPRPWTALPSSASLPRKGTAHSSRASAVVCVRLDARHTCACALVIPSNASASSRRLQRGLWAQNCTHWGYCRVRPTAPRLIPQEPSRGGGKEGEGERAAGQRTGQEARGRGQARTRATLHCNKRHGA